MARKPMILISSGRIMGSLSMARQQSELYGACLDAAGALGVLYTRGDAHQLAARCDGLVLSGGGDIHPALFGQQPIDDQLRIDPVRDAEEADLFDAFLEAKKPILGICRGLQVINVLLGGTLHQRINGHENGCHPICCAPRLASLIGPAPTVNSYHRQAAAEVAPSLDIAAHALDGTIEGLIHRTLPVLGVQWHPERIAPPLCGDVTGASHLALFGWLIERA